MLQLKVHCILIYKIIWLLYLQIVGSIGYIYIFCSLNHNTIKKNVWGAIVVNSSGEGFRSCSR